MSDTNYMEVKGSLFPIQRAWIKNIFLLLLYTSQNWAQKLLLNLNDSLLGESQNWKSWGVQLYS